MKKKLVIILILSMLMTSFDMRIADVSAKGNSRKVSLSKKNVTMYAGAKKTLKLKNAKKKVKWTVKNKKIAKISVKKGKYNNSITIRGVKAGKTKIVAKYGKKKYTIKIVVKKKKIQKRDEVSKKEEVEVETTASVRNDVTYATVKFETFGLGDVDNMQVKIGESYGNLPKPILIGNTFDRWVTKEGIEVTDTSICLGDITLYAEMTAIDGVIRDEEIIVD